MLALVAASYYAIVVYAWGPLLLRSGSRGSVAAALLVLAAFHLLVSAAITVMSWFGDAQKLTKALFSFASRLADVIIFVDEVNSLLGARGGAMEHEATRRMRNEFMAAWDGLRIYVYLPDAQNRMKILKILLAKENLESEFGFDELANATEGYSGSDLKGSAGSTKTSLRSLKLDEFVQAKAKVSPSVAFDATSMNKQRKWNKQYGEGGSRSKSSFGFGT
ncbi:Spastin [Hordeum vulgare]|nr:Spastin [Hordeum vulgare]